MRIEIDQSRRIEDTRVNTVLAFSNEISFSLLILAVDKRECLRRIRKRGETGKALYLKLFTAALFLLVKDFLDRLDSIIIDQEYEGKEKEIKGMLLNYIRMIEPSFPKDGIEVRRIGKGSRAHRKAIAVFRGEEKPNSRVKARRLLGLIR
jgi:hypothetical protein